MKKLKVYVIVCSYIVDGNYIDIDLIDVLKRLHIEEFHNFYGIHYNVDELVLWNFEKGYKAKYDIRKRFIDPENEKVLVYTTAFDHYISKSMAENFAEYLNEIHDKLYFSMTDEEAKIKLIGYGNDYTKQTKKEKK